MPRYVEGTHRAFERLAGRDGKVLIAGFGSLLSERSSRHTFPELEDFRGGRVRGWRRVFAHVAPVFMERGIADMATGEVSSLSCEEHRWDSELVVSLFRVPCSPEAMDAFVEREHEFRFAAVPAFELCGKRRVDQPAILCTRWSDDEYRRERCAGEEEFHRRYGRHGVDRVWRDDILPCRVYLRHCVLAARSLGPEAHRSFLDSTFLGDRSTTIRQYLAADPGIMDELPPPSLANRYCG